MQLQRWSLFVGLVAITLAQNLTTPHVSAQETPTPVLKTTWAKSVGDVPLPEYPRPQMTRPDWLSLNGWWEFEKAGQGSTLPRDRTLKERILVPFPVESALSRVGRSRDRQVWYRRSFEVPAAWKGKRVRLHFGAVNYESGVYLNGKLAGTHRGGYDAFSFDITDHLKEGANELIVGAINGADWSDQPRGRQAHEPRNTNYSACTGIWQTVWLEPVPVARIDNLIITPDVDSGSLEVRVEAANAEGDISKVQLFDGVTPIASGQGAAGTIVRLDVPNAKLWSPETPFLYDLKVTLLHENVVVDSVGSYAAMRKISLGKDEAGKARMLLNNKFLFQVGLLDQGYWPDGLYTAPTDEALKFDIAAAKDLGFNLLRKHVKVEPQRWYYWADKLGILVWQEMPNGNNSSPQTKRQFELELRRMVEGRRNHPSIITWTLFNEGWGQFDTERLVQSIKILDPTRLISNASGGQDKAVGDISDLHSYPTPKVNPPEPARASVAGEFGSLSYFVEAHSWKTQASDVAGDQKLNEPKYTNLEALTRRYEKLLRQGWRLKDELGASAIVYRQLADGENEANGLYSYDRAVLKMDAARLRAASRGESVEKPLPMIVPTAQAEAVEWKYTIKRPENEWTQAEYDETDWLTGPAPFGRVTPNPSPATSSVVPRTEWKTNDIWMRRVVELPEGIKDPVLLVLHDDDVEIYINGVLAAKEKDSSLGYNELPLSPEAIAALRPGKNLIAVHCRQRDAGQIIDVGLARYPE